MFRITALLVILTMTSVPAASAVCVAWCGAQTATSERCHEEDSPQIASAQGSCAALEQRPYVREDFRVTLDAAPGLPLSFVSTPLPAVVADLALVARHGIRSGPPSVPMVLRL